MHIIFKNNQIYKKNIVLIEKKLFTGTFCIHEPNRVNNNNNKTVTVIVLRPEIYPKPYTKYNINYGIQ